jgi:tetratricopeptide (TPR) repeat protein
VTPSVVVAAPPRLPGYEIVRELGRGGMGVVYLARQTALDRLVAVKMILSGLHAGPAELARFRTEAEAVARLQHPNIVQVFEVGQHDGRPFFSMEYVAGGSLDRRVAGVPQPPRAAAGLVETLARAVHAAHERGIVHRDLKPANILFRTEGKGPRTEEEKEPLSPQSSVLSPLIADFGLAKRLDAAGGQTPSGAVLGTPSYMAPEQAGGNKQVGPAADIYALGAILYQLLTGRPPFLADTPLDTILQVVADDPVAPSRLRPKLPRDLETVCLKCLAKEPARRYASAADLADDLARYLQDRPIRARPVGPLERFAKFARRNRILVGAAAAVFLALVLGITGTSIGLVRARADRGRAQQAQRDATADRDRARDAEREARRLLAESHRQAARLAMQRGAWRAALGQLDKALDAGHPDEVGLRFDKVRAWYAVHEVNRARRELEALARRSDLGDHEGPILLWQGDLEWDRTGEDKALELVRRAARKKLAPADAAYARGLLAKTSPEAVRHFQAALEADPFHRKANAMVASLLLFLGHLDEARERITFGQRLFPDDPTFKALRAGLLALHGDRKGSDVLLTQIRAQVTAPQVANARAVVEALHHVHQMNQLMEGSSDRSRWGLMMKVAPALARLASSLQTIPQERGPATADFVIPLPPVFVKAGRPLRGELLALVFRRYDRVIDRLAKVTAVHPEGLLHYFRGLLLLRKGRCAEAEREFVAAATVPSVAKVRKRALSDAVACQWFLAHQPGTENKAGMKAKALANTKELVALGISADDAPDLVVVALGTGNVNLARTIVADWERRAPADLGMRHKRLEVELAGGAYGRVLKTAELVLKQSAGDKVALHYQALARKKIAEQARALAPETGDKRR